MAKKRRSRRSNRRFRYTVAILIFSFSSFLFLHAQLPIALQLPRNHLFKSTIPSLSTSSTSTTASMKDESQRPRSWFQMLGSELRHSTNRSSSSSSPPDTRSKNLSLREIPKGPYPLIALNKSESRAYEGASWAASITKREGKNLPLHWLAELLHAAPKNPAPSTSSIFRARRKGAWMGCQRGTWLICKGAYRAIKKTNAITIVDTSCFANRKWLPHVINKLTTEFRLVRLTCLGKRVRGYDKKVSFLETDALTGALPNSTDLLIAYKFVQNGTLISAMKFFKNVKKAGVKYLLTENFPEEENVVKRVNGRNVLRLNSAMPPFWFPAPEYEYENKEESDEGMQIMVSRVQDLFEEKLTPGMAELVDPRKRTVRE